VKRLIPAVILFLSIGCSEHASNNRIEIVDGASLQAKLNRAAIVMRALVLDGYPDPSCTGPDADLVRCERLVNSELLSIDVYSNKDLGRVYLECVIHDDKKYDVLLADCLQRIREKLDDPVLKMMQDPEFVARKREFIEAREHEAAVIEIADWFGQTGLPEEIERQLPNYIRLEFGESLFDDDGLKAADLEYLGRFNQPDGSYHYWLLPSSDEETWYAYVRASDFLMGWGDRRPSDAE